MEKYRGTDRDRQLGEQLFTLSRNNIKYGKCSICGRLKPHIELCNCWEFVNGKIVKKGELNDRINSYADNHRCDNVSCELSRSDGL